MARRKPTFEALSPRFGGFDAFFAVEIVPLAPGLAASRRPWRIWGRRLLILAGLCYLAAAPAALFFYPAALATYRPWAIASCAILLPGVLFSLFGPADGDAPLPVSLPAWTKARRRIAGFFGFEHTPPLKGEALRQFIQACPAPMPALTGRLEARARLVGRIRAGQAAGVSLELLEGALDGAPVAACEFQFGAPSGGAGALLDGRIEGVRRVGLEALELPALPAPPGQARLAAFAATAEMGAMLTAPAILAALAEFVRESGAGGANLAIVDSAARLFYPLSAPMFARPDGPPTRSAIVRALCYYDALVRLAEALAPIFAAPAPSAESAASAGEVAPP